VEIRSFTGRGIDEAFLKLLVFGSPVPVLNFAFPALKKIPEFL
jgi:hypothetical protein